MTKSTFSPKYELFRKHLVFARENCGMTQVELAEKLGKPQSYVSKYERGERRLDVIEYLDITSALGVDAAKFISTLVAIL